MIRSWAARSWASVLLVVATARAARACLIGCDLTAENAPSRRENRRSRAVLVPGPVPEVVRHEGQGDRARCGGAQHVRAEPDRLPASGSQRGDLIGRQAPFRADDDADPVGALKPDLTDRRGGLLVQDQHHFTLGTSPRHDVDQVIAHHQRLYLGKMGATSLFGGSRGDLLPTLPSAVDLRPAPPAHRAGRLPRGYLAGPHFGAHLHGQFIAPT